MLSATLEKPLKVGELESFESARARILNPLGAISAISGLVGGVVSLPVIEGMPPRLESWTWPGVGILAADASTVLKVMKGFLSAWEEEAKAAESRILEGV